LSEGGEKGKLLVGFCAISQVHGELGEWDQIFLAVIERASRVIIRPFTGILPQGSKLAVDITANMSGVEIIADVRGEDPVSRHGWEYFGSHGKRASLRLRRD
jgi:hypothetical protein